MPQHFLTLFYMTPFATGREDGDLRENTRFYFSASSHPRKILLLKLKKNVANYYSHRAQNLSDLARPK